MCWYIEIIHVRLESANPHLLKCAAARSQSERSNADSRKLLIAGNFKIAGAAMMIDRHVLLLLSPTVMMQQHSSI